MGTPLIGVTIMPEYLQSEGPQQALDRLQQAGVNAVTTSPYVMEPSDEEHGAREPPADAGAGAVRLLDRPLWGRRELWTRTCPSFAPDVSLYEGLRYQPSSPEPLTESDGEVVDRLIEHARRRGVQVFVQVQAAIPPGYRVQFGGPIAEDQPQLPDGQIPHRRVSNNGSLASPHILDYLTALIRDLCRRYPGLSGLRLDWPEYPPYSLDDIFLDFSPWAAAAAERSGYDFEAMRSAAGRLHSLLHQRPDAAALRDAVAAAWQGRPWHELEDCWDGLSQWLQFKSTLCVQLLQRAYEAVQQYGPGMSLVPSAFPPPWNMLTGFNYRQSAACCDGINVKLYSMHWGMMVRFYADQLVRDHPDTSRSQLVEALVQCLDLSDGEPVVAADYQYPAPHLPHPGSLAAHQRKINAAQSAAGDTPVYALAHAYGPTEDFERRLAAACEGSQHGVWINRYGYLGDAKLAVIRTLCTS